MKFDLMTYFNMTHPTEQRCSQEELKKIREMMGIQETETLLEDAKTWQRQDASAVKAGIAFLMAADPTQDITFDISNGWDWSEPKTPLAKELDNILTLPGDSGYSFGQKLKNLCNQAQTSGIKVTKTKTDLKFG